MTAAPILYSFRRCPYAMRARLAIVYSGCKVELREIILRNKPQAMLDVSAKGTVPVLLLETGKVIDESFDIMQWALAQNDPQQWLPQTPVLAQECANLIEENDGSFKSHLDKYKYADRHPEFPASHYRQNGEVFLQTLNTRLTEHRYLMGEQLSLADIAIFPFVRQFAHVDKAWFEQAPYGPLRLWLAELIESELFVRIMKKYPQWLDSGVGILFPED